VGLDGRAARVGRLALAAEGEILLDAEREAERAAVAVFREVDDAGGARGGGGARPAFVAGEAERAGKGAEAGECLGELGLAVAVHAGDAEDFAGADLEGEAAQGGAGAVGPAGELPRFDESART